MIAFASSSVGSDIFACLALLVISILVLLLLRYYLPLRSTPAYLLIPVFLALALPLSIILLVPIDLASASASTTDGFHGIWLPEGVRTVTWRISYWLTFLLTWFVLPLLGDYIDSGYREPKDRLLYSLRSNGRYQLIVLSVSILGGVYFFLSNGFDGQSVKGLAMALAYTWGLVMAIYLMGHGLVAIPRRLFRNARPAERLKRLQAHAPKLHDRREEAQEELATMNAQVEQLRSARAGLRGDLKDWVDEVIDSSGNAPDTNGSIRSAAYAAPAVVTERYLADVSRKLKRARHKQARFEDEWDQLVLKAVHLQAILDAAGSKKLVLPDERKTWLTLLTPRTRYMLHANILPVIRIVAAALLGSASVALIWSEVVHAISVKLAKLSVVGLTIVSHPDSSDGQVGFGGQILAAAWLFYMCTAALYSMSEVKVWGNRALVKRQTYGESACWYSLQVAKLTVPLSYNFITMLEPTVYKETAFFNFLGKLINLTRLGKGFDQYFPLFILVPVTFTLFNLYGKIRNVFGFGVLDDESEENATGFGTGGWREGKLLIDRHIRDRSSSLLPTHHHSSSAAAAAAPFRDRPSLDGLRDAPSPTGPAFMPSAATARSQPPRRAVPPTDDVDEDDSERFFFQDIGERWKNTIDTFDKPKWMQDFAFKKPKWMGGGGDGESSGGVGGLFGGNNNNGGAAGDGRIRL